MTRVTWLTDIHLNFLPDAAVEQFCRTVADICPDAVLIGGDIAEAHDVCRYLADLSAMIPAAIYFVLGNHDYYHGSIRATRDRVQQFCSKVPELHYLSRDTWHELAPGVGLVGHDGWADGRLGDYPRSLVRMLDWKLIEELAGHDHMSRWEVLKGLADEGAAHIRRVLPEALAACHQVVLLTHVPPFLGACWHEGQISDAQWSPHFTSHAMGQAILEIMERHPAKRLTVLCGHTHGSGEYRPTNNVEVITGGAVYGAPAIARLMEF
jgi:Icc protein